MSPGGIVVTWSKASRSSVENWCCKKYVCRRWLDIDGSSRLLFNLMTREKWRCGVRCPRTSASFKLILLLWSDWDVKDVNYWWGAAIAQWIHLHLPSCCPGFEYQADHLHFNHFIELCNVETTKISKKRHGLAHFKIYWRMIWTNCGQSYKSSGSCC